MPGTDLFSQSLQTGGGCWRTVRMELADVMAELEKLGNESTKKTWLRHGATPPLFGVRIGDMKKLLKPLKGRQDLALALYATGNLDAMYLAGLAASGAEMSKKELESWAKAARWHMISEYTVPWVASEHPDARAIALKWMDAKQEHIACAGWNTYSGIVSMRPDAELDLAEIEGLLARVKQEIGQAKNRVRYCMNGFVMAVGAAVKPLLAKAKATAKALGKVAVDVGDTDCKVPVALETIEKIEKMGRVGTKRKTMKC
jgi:3-methyladenine DNA glycosylase AlkD